MSTAFTVAQVREAGEKAPWAPPHEHLDRLLAAETERWVRQALEKGPGWNVWRAGPREKPGEPFVIMYDFALVEPGARPPGAGLLYTQPELTAGERIRLLAGRHDWREHEWEDHCGVEECGHPCCEGFIRP